MDAPVDQPVDTPEGRCDPSKPFADVKPTPGLNTTAWDSNPSLSPDELTIYFASIRANPGSANGDLYVATRSNRDEAFGAASPIAALNTGADERSVSISPDELTMYFHSSRGTSYDVWFTTRVNPAATFEAPIALAAVNTSDIDASPNLAANGQTLYFDRAPSGQPTTIWKSTLTGSGFGTPTMVTELDSASAGGPVLSTDGLQIFFASNRNPTLGSNDIWTATRTSTSSPFDAPTSVTELNSSSDDRPGWVSPDGCRMYFFSTRAGGSGSFDVWQATRPQ